MTVQTCLQDVSVQKWLRRGALLALWMATTVAMAWATPFAVLAMCAAVAGGLGATADTAREIIVSLATLNQVEWASASGYWHGFEWWCATLVCAWRILTARPIERACGRALAHMSALIEPLSVAAGRLLARTDRRVKVLVAILPIASLLFVILAHEGQHSTEQLPRATAAVIAFPKALAAPATSAAISFPDGSILAGAVRVEPQPDGRFVLEFDPTDK